MKTKIILRTWTELTENNIKELEENIDIGLNSGYKIKNSNLSMETIAIEKSGITHLVYAIYVLMEKED